MFGSVCILHAYAYPRIEVEDESPAHLIKIDILSDPAVTFTLIRKGMSNTDLQRNPAYEN